MAKAKTDAVEGDVELRPFDFVYAGRTGTGKDIFAEVHVVVDGRLGRARHYDVKLLKGLAIGGVYRGASFTDEHARFPKNPEYVERWSDTAALMVWRALDDAVEAAQRLAKLETDTRKHSELEALLLPLRISYAGYVRRYDKAGQAALEQALLSALRAPPRRTELKGG